MQLLDEASDMESAARRHPYEQAQFVHSAVTDREKQHRRSSFSHRVQGLQQHRHPENLFSGVLLLDLFLHIPPGNVTPLRCATQPLERWPIEVPVWHNGEMKRPHASDDVRERALAAVDEGHPVADVAEFFQNDPSTIRRWIRQRQRTGSGVSRPRPGRARCLDAAHDELLRE